MLAHVSQPGFVHSFLCGIIGIVNLFSVYLTILAVGSAPGRTSTLLFRPSPTVASRQITPPSFTRAQCMCLEHVRCRVHGKLRLRMSRKSALDIPRRGESVHRRQPAMLRPGSASAPVRASAGATATSTRTDHSDKSSLHLDPQADN